GSPFLWAGNGRASSLLARGSIGSGYSVTIVFFFLTTVCVLPSNEIVHWEFSSSIIQLSLWRCLASSLTLCSVIVLNASSRVILIWMASHTDVACVPICSAVGSSSLPEDFELAPFGSIPM